MLAGARGPPVRSGFQVTQGEVLSYSVLGEACAEFYKGVQISKPMLSEFP